MTVWVQEASEDEEEATFTDWLDLQGYTHWHVPNDQWTQSWSVKAKNRKLGVLKGVSDHFIITKRKIVAIEMKKAHGGSVSDEQYLFLENFNRSEGGIGLVAHGAGEAITIITAIEQNDRELIDAMLKDLQKKIDKRKATIAKRNKTF